MQTGELRVPEPVWGAVRMHIQVCGCDRSPRRGELGGGVLTARISGAGQVPGVGCRVPRGRQPSLHTHRWPRSSRPRHWEQSGLPTAQL